MSLSPMSHIMMIRPTHLAGFLLAFATAGLVASVFGSPEAPTGEGIRGDAVAAGAGPRDDAPPRPADCVEVSPNDDLGRTIDGLDAGASICLAEGDYSGPIRIDSPVSIWGPPGATIRSSGEDSTIFVHADDVRLAGFTIAGSGQRYVDQDAGIFVSESTDVVIDHLAITDVLFGVTSQKVDQLTVRDTTIRCRSKRALGMRGDGIRLWETRRSRIAHNELDECRDLVVWYSPENVIEGNRVSSGRYGTHFMYSSRNIITNNAYVGNVVGIFVMYSRNMLIDSNILADAAGSAGVGLGLKESGNLEITRNRFLHNTVGSYIDTSPLHRDDRNLYALNEFRLGNAGVVFHSSPRANEFLSNTFQDNVETVRVEGGGDATGIPWERNFFGGYAGYDMDRDGTGDVPFELRTVSGMLRSRYPNLDVFHGSAAMFAIEAASRISPMYSPDLVLTDEKPRMYAPSRAELDEKLRSIRRRHDVLAIDRSGDFPVVRGRDEEPRDESQRY